MRKITGIYVEMKGDSTQLRKDMAQARQLVTEQARGMSDALNNALSPGQIGSSIKTLTANLGTLSRSAKITGQDFGKLGVDLGQLQKVTGITESQFAKLQSQLLQAQSAKVQEKALRDIAKAAALTEKEVKALGTQMGLSKAQIEKVTGAAKETGRSFDLVGSAAKAALAYLSVSQMASFGKAVFDVGINLDSLQRSFTAIAGSTAGMRDEFDFLRQTAEDTGQNFYKLTDGYKMLIASSRETQLEGEQTRKIFSAMSEAAAVLGMSTEGVDRSFKALGQMMSKGTVQAEELKGQLGDHLPGALQIAARAMDVSTRQLMKMMESGDVLATDLLPKLADELHRMYGEAAKTAAA